MALDIDKAGREASSIIFKELANSGYYVADAILDADEIKQASLAYKIC